MGAIEIERVTSFSGGIVNASGGLISARGTAIGFFNDGTFAGGITNAGKLVAKSFVGIGVFAASQFDGGITNGGSITAPTGIYVASVASFGTVDPRGGIVNSGTLSATGVSRTGVHVDDVSVFAGGISNTGKIVQTGLGFGNDVYVSAVAAFSGGIVNTGTMTGASRSGNGILVDGASVFSGVSAIAAPFPSRLQAFWSWVSPPLRAASATAAPSRPATSASNSAAAPISGRGFPHLREDCQHRKRVGGNNRYSGPWSRDVQFVDYPSRHL